MNDKVHFHVTLKSIDELPVAVEPSLAEMPDSLPLTQKIRPMGDFYFINPSLPLKDDDWVIFGVASTDDIDLQNETVDAKEVFGDHLEEFVSVGKVFYEHGYRYAKDASPENRIDEPIGYPYMVEIFNNQLWIWVVLDKSHPLAQKVWDSLHNTDARFRNKWGFSIGAITLGQPKSVSDNKFGRVRKLPKMRLYEVSVTPQPVNPYTWAEVVKSLVVEEESMSDENRKNLPEEIVDAQSGESLPDVDIPTSEGGSPEPERRDLEESVDVSKAVEGEEEKEEAPAEEGAEDVPAEEGAEEKTTGDEIVEDLENTLGEEEAAGTEEKEAAAEATPEADKGDVEEAAQAPEEGKEEGEDNSVLMDLLGDEEGGAPEEAEGGDASLEMILDKLDMLSNRLDELAAKFSKLFDVEVQEHGEEALEEPAEEEGPKVSEEVLAKALAPVLDELDMLHKKLDAQENAYKSILEGAATKSVQSIEVPKSDAEEALKAREEFVAHGTVTKSVSDSAPEDVEVVEEVSDGNATMKSLSENVDKILGEEETSVYEKILKDPELLEVAKSLAESLKTLESRSQEGKITPATYALRRSEIFKMAEQTLGLDRVAFKSLLSAE